MRGRGPSLSPSSAPCLYPLVLSLHNGARESHPALSYPCFLFPQLSPLSPHLWPHRNCFLKPPAGTALTRESLVAEDAPAGLSLESGQRHLLPGPQQWHGTATRQALTD